MITIYDTKLNNIGIASRQEVHQKGYWHQTFQCWFVHTNDIFLQIRSNSKKDFPGLLDITAAGHVLAGERIEDGIREIQEELGIDVSISELTPIGIIKDCIEIPPFVDKEFANVFVYDYNPKVQPLHFQDNEVSGMVCANIDDLYRLFSNEVEEIQVTGYWKDKYGVSTPIQKKVHKAHFVPHDSYYFLLVIERIKNRR
ncbi:NUDIX hydrolase [Salirhabdus sp. Marseille-P4669]|uniref:NUDIX hydrolase n=1 Tax=Salirhabdus sp. Marseille-P4669 TaxID=2042310 RepID=UPI000C7E69DE|nr:NUDIX domain-containing protein [Salirhabdus sp. Marseille-P4669]